MDSAAKQRSARSAEHADALLSEQASTLYTISGPEVGRLRQQIRSTEQLPYEELDATTASESAVLDRAERLLASGWRRDGQYLESLTPPLPWDALGRSFSFRLHAFEPLSPLLSAYDQSGRRDFFGQASEAALSWIGAFQQPLFSGDLPGDIERARAAEGTMAWYDMSVGLRIYRLAYILDVTAREDAETAPDDVVRDLVRALVFHQELLSIDDFFASHNNHGFYQAVGQLAAARRFRYLPGFESYVALAEKRLRLMFERNFFRSGPHREHSPAYHYMVLGSALGARRSGLLDEDSAATLSEAETALGWMTQPDGARVAFGDTDPQPGYFSADAAAQFEDPDLKAVLTGGAAPGTVPEGLKVYEEAGYVFARFLPEGDRGKLKEASYFAQIAGFHSRTHKHADHLSFVWIEGGRSILVDPGRYGYVGKTSLGDELSRAGFFYSDQRRIYVERTRAHNCVEIDGQDYGRKDVEPFGSAIMAAGERNGLVASLCEVRHQGGVSHTRLVVLLAGSFLVVVDLLGDPNEAEHSFRQWFQLAPEWQGLEVEGEILRCSTGEGSDMHLCAAPLVAGAQLQGVHIGESDPEMAGWYSDAAQSLVPSPSICWRAPDAARARFATVFSLSRELSTERDASFVGDDLEGRLCWADEKGRHVLELSSMGGGVSVNYSCEETGRSESVTAHAAAAGQQARRFRARIGELEDRLQGEQRTAAAQAERLERFGARVRELDAKLAAAIEARTAQAERSERFKARTQELEEKLAAAQDWKAEQQKRSEALQKEAAALKVRLAEGEDERARRAEMARTLERVNETMTRRFDRLEQQLGAERRKRESELQAATARNRSLEAQVESLRSSVRYRLGSAIVMLPKSPRRALSAARGAFRARRHKELIRLLDSYGFDNTGVRLEAYSSRIAGHLTDAESQQAAASLRSGAAHDGLAALTRIAASRPAMSASALLHLRRAEAVLRCARSGFELPARSGARAYEPEPRRAFYVTHMRAPLVSNGYVTRTQTILSALRSCEVDPIGVTRLGFPNDLTATEGADIGDEEVVQGTRFLTLHDDEGGLRGRPVDDYIDTYAERLGALAGEHRPAVLHAVSNYMNGLAAIKAGRQLGVPVIYEARGLWQLTAVSRDPAYEQTERYRLENRLEEQAALEADLVIAISDGLKAHFVDCGVAPERVFVVPNGVDAEQFRPIARDEALASELGLNADDVVVGYIGSLLDYEGIDLVLSAVAELRKRGNERLRALIIGRGREAHALQAHAQSLGIADACIFPGRIPPDEVQRHYSLIDIAPFARKLQPVTRLVPPLKPMEAMAMERATIVSDIPALADIGEDGVSSLHVRHDDVGSLVEAIGTLANDPARRRALAEAGRQWVMGARSLDAIGARLRAAYDALGLSV